MDQNKHQSYVIAMRSLQHKVRELNQQIAHLNQELLVKQDIIDSKNRDIELAVEQLFRKGREMDFMQLEHEERQSKLRRQILAGKQVMKDQDERMKLTTEKHSLSILAFKVEIQELKREAVIFGEQKEFNELKGNELRLQNQALESQIKKLKDLLGNQRDRRKALQSEQHYKRIDSECKLKPSQCLTSHTHIHTDQRTSFLDEQSRFSFSGMRSEISANQDEEDHHRTRVLQKELSQLTQEYEKKAAEAMKEDTPVQRLKDLRKQMGEKAKEIQLKHEQLFKLKSE